MYGKMSAMYGMSSAKYGKKSLKYGFDFALTEPHLPQFVVGQVRRQKEVFVVGQVRKSYDKKWDNHSSEIRMGGDE
jgi:hypothetical protein